MWSVLLVYRPGVRRVESDDRPVPFPAGGGPSMIVNYTELVRQSGETFAHI